ncbi:organic solute transporter subunit beta [Mustelus asterias]
MSELKRDLYGWLTLCVLLQEHLGITLAKTQTLSAGYKETGDGVIRDVRQNETRLEETTTAKQLPYPMEDSTNWNYAMLVLAFIALFLGFLILTLCSRANRKRKMKALNELNAAGSEPVQKMMVQHANETDNSAETDQMLQTKNQAYVFLDQVPHSSSPKISPKPGEVVIEWKDGNISSLFTVATEDDV